MGQRYFPGRVIPSEKETGKWTFTYCTDAKRSPPAMLVYEEHGTPLFEYDEKPPQPTTFEHVREARSAMQKFCENSYYMEPGPIPTVIGLYWARVANDFVDFNWSPAEVWRNPTTNELFAHVIAERGSVILESLEWGQRIELPTKPSKEETEAMVKKPRTNNGSVLLKVMHTRAMEAPHEEIDMENTQPWVKHWLKTGLVMRDEFRAAGMEKSAYAVEELVRENIELGKIFGDVDKATTVETLEEELANDCANENMVQT